jgi:hypothetical protein
MATIVLVPQTANSVPLDDALINEHEPSNQETISQHPSSLTKNEGKMVDIEHVQVDDDPRLWSNARKVRT